MTVALSNSATAGTALIRYSGKKVSDASITSISPYFNGGNQIWGNVAYFSSNGNTERTFLQIPVPEIINELSPSRISKAYINITFSGLESDSFKICLNEVFDSLNELSISWNNQPTFDEIALDTIILRKAYVNQNPIDTIVSFDITQLLIKNLISEKRKSINVVFKALLENWPEQNVCTFSSSDDPIAEQWPELIIESSDLPDTLFTDYSTSIKQT